MARNNFDKLTFERSVSRTSRDGRWSVGRIKGEPAERPHINSPRLRNVNLFIINGIEYDGSVSVEWDERRGEAVVSGIYLTRPNTFGAGGLTDSARSAVWDLVKDPRAVEAFAKPTDEEVAAADATAGRRLAENIVSDVEYRLRREADGTLPAVREAAVAALVTKLREIALKLEVGA